MTKFIAGFVLGLLTLSVMAQMGENKPATRYIYKDGEDAALGGANGQ